VAKGQVIVILPGMYSGGTDWVDTPSGKRPESHVILSMLNRILLDSWLSLSGYESLMTFIAGFLDTVISSLFSTVASWFLMITSCLLVIFARDRAINHPFFGKQCLMDLFRSRSKGAF